MQDASIGPYRVVERLGAGGMGEVYLAVDTRLNRKVALKYLSDPSLDVPHARERLLREARAAAQITHPNIAAIYDILDSDAHPCIVMEYAQGDTLARIAERGPMLCPQALQIGIQLADALAHAHAAGVIHRDLKPANVVLTADGLVKVLDFGLARVRDIEQELADADAPTREKLESCAGRQAGTPAYMAPEQLAGKPASPLSDIYSLGVTLFEVVTGRRPFSGATTPDLVSQVLWKPTPLASSANGSVPPMVDAVVAKAMARDPARRYPSAEQMADDLRKAERAMGTGSDDLSMHAPSSAGSASGLDVELGPTKMRRRQLAALAAVLIAGGTLAGLGYALWGRRTTAPAAASQYVAVLPFVDHTDDPNATSVAVSFSESLIAALEGLSSVTVLSGRDTAEHLASAADVRKGAGELGVTMVVRGDIARRGTGRQLTVELHRPDGKVVFNRRYDAAASDVSKVQRSVVTDVVAALNVNLTPADYGRLQRAPACRADAYGDYARGRALLNREDVPGNAAKAEEAFSRAATKDPKCAPAFSGLADARWARYNDTKDPALVALASRAVEAAYALDPGNPAINISLATLYLNQGKTNQAERVIRGVVEHRPFDDEPHRILSSILAQQGRTEEATAELQRAIELRPTNVINHVALGNSYYYAQRYPDAAAAYKKVLEIQPDNLWAISNLGAAYWMNGDTRRALAVYEAARHPDATILSNTGSIYFREGRYQDALRVLKRAVELASRDDVKRRNLGDTYLMLGLKQEALDQYRHAAELTREQLKVNDKDARMLARLALYDAKLGRAAESLQHANRAVALSPDDNYVLYKCAVVHCLLDQPVEAVAWLRRAIEKEYPLSDARSDPDLGPIRKRPEVQELLRVKR